MLNENETNVDETTVSNEEEEVVEVDETETEDEQESESLEDKIARLEKENRSLKIQKGKIKAKAERAEEAPKAESKVELSQMDILAIAKSDVHQDDIERVTKFAKMEGISVQEALGNDDLKAVLERRAEQRKVAQASNTGSTAPTRGGVSGTQLVANARKGNLPDVSDLDALFEAEKKK